MNLAITLLAFIVALGVLIVFHEFGHYLIARLFGVKVLPFLDRVRKSLWRFEAAGPDRVGDEALPLGGYVKNARRTREAGRAEEVHGHSIARAFGGASRSSLGAPAANFLLAVVFYWALFVGGVQEAKPVVGTPDPEPSRRRAASSGARRSLKITTSDGQSQQVRWRLLQLAVENNQRASK